jgi:osmotically-inducible protein OsmY
MGRSFMLGMIVGACASVMVGCATTGAPVDDSTVSAKVKTELVAESDLQAVEVRVRTHQGQVQLSGFVTSLEQKQRASDLARRVPGVRWVRNDLIVKATAPPAAGQIREPSGAER